MPASVYTDMNANSSGLEDHRTLQIAMELSMLGLNGEDEGSGINSSSFEDGLRKSSTNMTECVPVPSSEHVAEIVGRQGCKIKALRAKTNTYIKTPVRGEEPVFVVTGRREDVGSAKREILSAAEHFSQIRASRRNNSVSSISSTGSNLTPGPPSPSAPGQVTIQVRVPYRVVGLVVGPKGATIKRIQQQTHTYIVTPSRDKEPVFEVTGLPENVEKARQEIESHIAMRTGGMVDAHLDDGDFQSNGVDSGFHELNSDMVGSMYKMSNSNSPYTTYSNNSNNLLSRQEQETIFNFPPVNGSTKITDFVPVTNGFSGFNGFGIYDNDEGIASPSFDSTTNSHSLWSELGDNQNDLVSTIFGTASTAVNLPRRSSSLGGGCTTPRLSPTLTDSSSTSNINAAIGDHPMVRRIRSDPLSGGLASLSSFSPLPNSNYASTSGASSTSSSPTDSTGSGSHIRRSCLLCSDSMIVAALVPCGHNLFCMECANLIMDKPAVERSCPVCQQTPTQAIRIFS